MSPSRTLKARPTTVYQPRSLDALHNARLRSLYERESEKVEWDRVEVLSPDVEDKHTLSQLARMAGNAYALPGRKNWYEVDPAWNTSFPFGWEDSDGFRGHVFLSSDNSTIVLSIKGTTLNGPTSKKDKFNDNLRALARRCTGQPSRIYLRARRHVIREVITKVIEAEDVEWEDGREVPLAREEVDCVDCFKWEFGNYKDEDGAPS
ncbi:hypothetical protein DXG03_001926 [Asterophora parasitica]|uniref:triacylglycerol lipase n=1 Tax=Asterophora parasitica TaxID=117018 RepID=A0A9P7KBA2_9AGAR|nr:hypothetical protein DXG03_001926 [Asterophora parasitica]